MDFIMGFMFGAVALGFACHNGTEDEWEDRLIEAELAEFVVYSTTGDTTFIIYAEQSNTK
jgi:hypothetical protein